ncbi:MAG: ESX secretion-associated protein EspG [Rhodococcus sp.]|nr:ESX secretion-associated protein EspG [Rhodococcus sp. (in: high G+C Gram-positive bacteria)]
MRNWQISAPQFAALYSSHQVELLPYPFDIVLPYEYVELNDKFFEEVRVAFNRPQFDHLRSAVKVLAEPEIYVQVSGINAQGEKIRVIAAQVQHLVAIAVQLPGPSPMKGGDVIIAYSEAGKLGTQIVGVLPANASGTKEFASRQESTQEQEYDYSASIFTTVTATATRPRLEDVVSQIVGQGLVEVHSGPRHDRNGSHYKTKWIDIAADGRYVLGPKNFDNAVPCDPAGLIKRVDAMVLKTLQDVRNPDRY